MHTTAWICGLQLLNRMELNLSVNMKLVLVICIIKVVLTHFYYPLFKQSSEIRVQ